MRKLYLALFLLFATVANAQTVQQSGTVTPGHPVRWITNGIIGDAGTAANSTLTSLGVVNSGPSICQQSAATSTGNYNQICLATSSTGAGQLITQNYGSVAAQGFQLVIDGATVTIPASTGTLAVVTAPTTSGTASCFNSLGALTSCGVAISAGTQNGVPVYTAAGVLTSSGAIPTCTNALQYDSSSRTWTCGTNVTSITAGTGLSGGTITGSGTISLTVPVPTALGGTGQTSLTNHGVLIGQDGTAMIGLAAATAGTVLQGQGTSSDPAFTATATLGVAGTTKGTIALSGNTSGAVTIQPAAVAGTWTMTLPTSGGTNNYVLSTDGTGITTWVAQSGGSGSVTSVTCGTGLSGGTITTTGTCSITAPVTVALGGTGQTSLTNHGVVIGAGTSGVSILAAAAAGTVLQGGGASADPAFSATPTLGVAGTTAGTLAFSGVTSGTTVVASTSTASGTLTLPAATDTLIGKATTDTLTNKTYDTAGTGNVFKINGTTISATTGSGAAVLANTPTLITPVLGVATGTSVTLGANGGTGGTLVYKGSTSGTVTTQVAAAAGTWSFTWPATAGTSGQFLQTNGSGVAVWADSTGSGTVNSGTAGQLAYYASSTTAVSGNANFTVSAGALTLGVATSVIGQLKLAGNTSGTVTMTPAAAAGTWTMTLPTGAGTSGFVLTTDGAGVTSWAAAPNGAVPTGGTTGQVLAKVSNTNFDTTWTTVSGTGTVTSVVCGTGLSGGTITTSGTCSITAPVTVALGGTGATTLTNHGVLVGAATSAVTQLAAAAAGTLLTGQGASSDPSFSATPTLGIAGTTLGTLAFAGNTSGTVTVRPAAVAGTWTFTWPASGGTSGQFLTTDGSGGATWTSGGTVTSVTCGTGLSGGTFTTSGTCSLTNPVTVSLGGTGAATLTQHGVVIGNGTTAVTVLAVAAAGTVLTGVASSDPAFSATPTLGVAGTTKGTLAFAGNTSGTVTVQPAAAAGTWSLTWPTTAGTSGQVLQTDGAGVTTWASTATGSVTSVTCGSGLTGGTFTTTGTCALSTPVAVSSGGTGATSYAVHQVLVATGSTTLTAKTLPDCVDTAGNHLNFTQSTDAFSCGTSAVAAGSSGQLQYNNAGALGGVAASAYATSGNIITFTAPAATDVVLTVKGAASQSGDLQRWVSSTPTTLAKVSSAGAGTFAGMTVSTLNSAGVVTTDASGNLATNSTLPAARFPALTGDVTTSAGAVATTIAAAAVTYAKFQTVTARSVVGVTGNATATAAAIQGTTNQVLRVDTAGTGLSFGAVNLASSAAVTGNLSVNNLNSGTSASSATFWRGDGTWAAAGGIAQANCANAAGDSDIVQAAINLSTKAVHIVGPCVGDKAITPKSGQLIYGDGRTVTVFTVTTNVTACATGNANAVCAGLFVFNATEPGPILQDFGIVFAQANSSTSTSAATVRATFTNYNPAIYAQNTPRFKIFRLRIDAAMIAIDMRNNAGGAIIDDLEANAFSVGIYIDGSLDTVRLNKVHFWPFASGFAGCSANGYIQGTATGWCAVFGAANSTCTPSTTSTGNGAIGVWSGRMDDLKVSDSLFISGMGICLQAGTGGAGGTTWCKGTTFGAMTNVSFDSASGLSVNQPSGTYAVSGPSGCASPSTYPAGIMTVGNSYFSLGSDTYVAIAFSAGFLHCTGCWVAASATGSTSAIQAVASAADYNFSFTGGQCDTGGADRSCFQANTSGTMMVEGTRFIRTGSGTYTASTINCQTGARCSLIGNRSIDKSGSAATFITLQSDDYHVAMGNIAPGWTNSNAARTNAIVCGNQSAFTNSGGC